MGNQENALPLKKISPDLLALLPSATVAAIQDRRTGDQENALSSEKDFS